MDLKVLIKRSAMTMMMVMLCVIAFAQSGTVKGVVKDASGEPIIGASVLVKGTSNGTVTNLDGQFTIQGVKSNATLEVSYVGYTTQQVKAGPGTLNVILKEGDKTLDEVVVIGYGTVKRRDLTGAVASVSGDKLVANPVANVVQALQGQLPGVSVTSQDGRPGASMTVRVRGGGSITQSNDPLYIVDGVQVSNIEDIPADNIESIDVLKDGASTAIYGARGANGVILVTTKGAKEGKVKVNYNGYMRVNTLPSTLDVMSAYDYVLWDWEYATAYGTSYGDGTAKYFGLGSTYGNHLAEYKNVKAHNYMDDVLKTSTSWNHDITITGGTDKTKVYATLNYLNDDGMRIETGFRRWHGNFKIDQQITKNLMFNADLRYSEMRITGAQFGYSTEAYRYRPIDNPLGDATYSTGLGLGEGNVELPTIVDRIKSYSNVTNRYHVSGRGALTWTVIKGLTAKTELSLSRNWNETDYWDGGVDPNGQKTRYAKISKGDGYNVRWTSTVNYELQGLGEDNKLSFLAGNEVLASKSNSSYMIGAGYPVAFTSDDAFGNINMTDSSLGKDEYSNTIGTPSHSLSWFGRANYSYKGRYLLTATFRADGSSKFAPNNHWGYFPSAAAAWRISDEPFMKAAKDSWLDNLKLRLSLGTSGADNIDASLWKETWTTKSVTVNNVPTTVYEPGDMMGNPDLKWERTISRNIGIDFGLFGRINGSVELYWNTTKDILMSVPIDPTLGYTYQFQNVGQTSNKGIEFSVNADIIRTKDFHLSLNATYNFNHNNIDKLADKVNADAHTNWGSTMRKPNYDYCIRKGQPVGAIYGFKSEGFYKTSDFNYDTSTGVWTLKDGVPDTKSIVNYAGTGNFKLASGQTAFPGMVKFADANGDGVINDDDATKLGNAVASHTGGFNINASYKGFDASAGFTYQIGGKVYNANAMWSMMGNKDTGLGCNRLSIVSDCYKIYSIDDNGNLVAATTPEALDALNANAKYALNYSEYGLVSSEFVEDASYLRLQTLTVGYTLPKTLTNKFGISRFRIYFTGTNLFCITGYSGLDPDVNTAEFTGGFPTPNYDYNSYPKARSFTFGINLTF